jgi:dolichol-phosphate mannosyltransferase
MDADLQYPPEGLPGLLRVLGDDPALDVVVASRYGPGASRGPWSARRHLVSRAAIGLAKLALPRALGQLRDPNAGYFLLRRRVIQDVDLRPLGYKILIEVLARGRWHRMREIPQDYQERPAGTSKLGVRQSVEFVVHVARLAWETRVIPAAAAGHRPWPPRALR